MKRHTILLAMLCFFALTLAHAAAAQDVNTTGKWTATIHATDKTMVQSWDLKQDGNKIMGKVKSDTGELPLTGTLDGSIIRALVTDGDQHYQVHLNVDGGDADGTIRMGKNEFLLMLKKDKT